MSIRTRFGWRAGAAALFAAVLLASAPLGPSEIEQGAPADLFASADLDWMDYAQSKGLVRPDTRVNLLGNRLVRTEDVEPRAHADAPP